MTHSHYIELVGKVVRVAETLVDEPGGLSLQEMASRTGYVKSSVHRILHSLRRHGYIEQTGPGGKYRLGLQFLVLASGIAARIELVKMGRPFLHELVDRFGESAFLAILREGKGVFVDLEEAPGTLRLIGPIGAIVHFHATAAGKAMAAYFPEEVRSAILRCGPLPALTARTLIQPHEVENDWEEVRRRGYALNDEETIVGASYVAAPVFDSRKQVCGSISVGVPKARFTPGLSDAIADHLIDACRRLSEMLRAAGYAHITGNLQVSNQDNEPIQQGR